MPKLSKGVMFGLLAAFNFSLMILFVKAAKPIPPQEVIFTRSVFNLFFSYGLLKIQKVPIWGKKSNVALLILRGLSGYLALSAYFFSLNKLPIGTASIIQYMSPVFSGIMAHFILRENSSSKQWLCLLLGLLGIGFISHFLPFPVLDKSIEWYYWMACLLSAALSGIAYICVRKLSLLRENPEVIVFYFPLLSLPLSLVFGFKSWIMPNMLQILLLIGVGITSYLGQVFLTYSLKNEKTSVATNTLYFGALFATIWGIIFFKEIPDWQLAAGALLIIGSQIIFLQKREEPPNKLQPREFSQRSIQ